VGSPTTATPAARRPRAGAAILVARTWTQLDS
jgi:hypothetical protein